MLLIKRGEPPFRGRWALPGGFVRVEGGANGRGESLDDAVARVLAEETGLTQRQVYVEQLGAFGAPDRDPRMRVISVAYYALVRRPIWSNRVTSRVATRARLRGWSRSRKLELAFDHAIIIEAARTRIR